MGIDITGFSHARRIAGRHSDEVCEADAHYAVGRYRKLLDGRKPGCYICDGKSFYLYASYYGFDRWRDDLSLILYGVPVGDLLENPKRFRGKPLFDLIALPFTNDIGIGPLTSARLYEEFVKCSRKAKRGLEQLAAEAISQRANKKKSTSRFSSHGAKVAQSLAKALGGVAIGSNDDPDSVVWEWKWKLYRDFRRAFKTACEDGIVLVSI